MRYRPLLLLALSFAAGDAAWAVAPHSLVVVGCIAAFGLLLIAFGGHRWRVAAVGLVLTGMGIGAFRLASFQTTAPNDIARWADPATYATITGTVASEPDIHNHGLITFTLHAERLACHGQSHDVTGDTWISISPQRSSTNRNRYSQPTKHNNRETEVGPNGVTGELPVDYGDRVTVTGRLDTPREATNPGGFSWKDYLSRRAIGCQVSLRRPSDLTRNGPGGNPYLHGASGVRRKLLASLQAALPATSCALLSGILIGARSNLPPDLMADFIHTGTVHILASAGLHVGVIALWLMVAFRGLTVHRKLSAALIILLLVTFAIMAGGRPRGHPLYM